MIIRCLDPWGTIRVPIRVLQGLGVLGGSWVCSKWVRSPSMWVLTTVTLLINLLIRNPK